MLDLLAKVLIPSESEVLFNAVSQLKSLHDWHQKLIKIETIVSTSGSADAMLLIREASTLQRSQQARNTRASSTFPLDSMLLILVVLMMLVNKTIKPRR